MTEDGRIFHSGIRCTCKRPWYGRKNEDGTDYLWDFECIGYYEDCPWRNNKK